MSASFFLIICCVGLWAAAKAFRKINPQILRGMAIAGKLLLIVLVGFMLLNVLAGQEERRRVLAAFTAIFLLLSVLLLFSNQIRNKFTGNQSMTGILAAFTPICSFFLIEYVSNSSLEKMTYTRIVQNILYLAVLFLLFFFAVPWKRFAVGAFWIVSFAFGALNHYLTLFRGNPLMPADIFSVGTAFQVAGGYEFSVTGKLLTGALLCFGCIVLLSISPGTKKTTKKGFLIKAIVNVMIAVICLNFVLQTNIAATYRVRTKLWNVQKAYNSYGAVLSFANLTQKIHVAQPKDYDRKSVNELLKTYVPAEKEDESTVHPTIIAVMMEAFSDLRALGDFEISEEYLENWYARKDYVYRGNCYVSVLGGNTANSEFEFLTGNSLGFLPSGVLPYQSYSMKNVGNLSSILADSGYLRTAFHPAKKGNWNRQRVYDNFGFEQFFGIDDVENPAYIRNRISDTCDFEKLIELYEENQGSQQFLFNVTIQNHGGYEIKSMEGQDLIQTKEEWEKYTDVTTYLTLVRESDQAVDQLISYFSQVDEPVILCIYGDHQPSLDKKWRESVLGQSEDGIALQDMQKKYVTPYMIWANYDTGIEPQETDLSANYLGALLLDAAGISGSAYTNFLLDMRQYVPAINAFGYMTPDGNWHSMDEKTEASEWINKYRNIEYNAMFDFGRDMIYYS